MLTKDELGKMEIARHLLPEPGPEVVGQLLTEVKRLHEGLDGTEQLRQEINNIINRYAAECDLTAAQTFGVLEICKLDLAEKLKESGGDKAA